MTSSPSRDETGWWHRFLYGRELPVLTVMPKHVAELKLDPGLILIHMERAEFPNPAVVTGHIKPAREFPQ